MPKPDLDAVRDKIALEIDGGRTFEEIACALGINRGIVWKLYNRPDYRPEITTLHKLGLTRELPRPRLIAAVSAEQKRTVSEAAKAAGMTEARWIRIKLGLEE